MKIIGRKKFGDTVPVTECDKITFDFGQYEGDAVIYYRNGIKQGSIDMSDIKEITD